MHRGRLVCEEGNSDERENVCDGADGGFLWKTGDRLVPEAKR
jgi:hypothetical protein